MIDTIIAHIKSFMYLSKIGISDISSIFCSTELECYLIEDKNKCLEALLSRIIWLIESRGRVYYTKYVKVCTGDSTTENKVRPFNML